MRAEQIEIPVNLVLIKPDEDYTETSSGLNVKGVKEDRSKRQQNTLARHYAITGTVITVPNKLLFRGDQHARVLAATGGVYNDFSLKDLTDVVNGSMEYDVEMELKVGDKIWFDYGCHYNANVEKKILDIEGVGKCYLIDYEAIFLRERSGIKTPVNGWIWIKKIDAIQSSPSGLIVTSKKSKHLKDIAEVVKIGSPIKKYLSTLHKDFPEPICEGQRIVYHEKLSTPIEYVIHKTEGLEGLYKIKRKDIIALID